MISILLTVFYFFSMNAPHVNSAFAQENLGKDNPKIYLANQNTWIRAQTVNDDPEPARASLSFLSWIFPSPLSEQVLQKTAIRFLWENQRAMGISNANIFHVIQIVKGKALTTARIDRKQEIYIDNSPQTVEVKGAETLLHFQNERPSFANIVAFPETKNYSQKISLAEAESLAIASYGTNYSQAKTPKLKLLYFRGKTHLVYEVTIFDSNPLLYQTYFISAESGALLYSEANTHTAKERIVMVGSATEQDGNQLENFLSSPSEPLSKNIMDIFPVIFQEQGCSENSFSISAHSENSPEACLNANNPIAIEAASDAWKNMGTVYDFFSNFFDRDSIDDKGMPLRSIVNFLSNWPNAAWVSGAHTMIYGNGDPNLTNNFAKTLDITAHELTHGITETTAMLAYVDESGALNESYSDVFAKLVSIESEGFQDWTIGKGVYRNPLRFLRDMENPEISHANNLLFRNTTCIPENDNCGVHKNSGVANRAAVLLAQTIGTEDLGKIYYLTLTQLLRPYSTFSEAKAQSYAACEILFGTKSTKCAKVLEAFTNVGIE